MKREITKPIGKNFEAGKVYDLPLSTWNAIANTIRGDSKKKVSLDSFSKLKGETA